MPSRPVPAPPREQAAEVKHDLYLDRSIPAQYVHWVKDLVTLDWGTTFQTNQPIREQLGRAFPISLRLMIYAQLLALGFAIPMGMWSAYKQGAGVDRADHHRVVRPAGHAASTSWRRCSSTCSRCDWDGSPTRPRTSASSTIRSSTSRPSCCPPSPSRIPLYATYMRLLRADLIATLQSDFITTARAKGLSTKRILFGHALRPSLFSLVTAAAVSTGALIGGVVIVEQTFQLNGMGRVTVEGSSEREYPTVQYGVVILALVYVFVNFFVDLAYAWIDPRVRHARALG